jgi:hypothetical protein
VVTDLESQKFVHGCQRSAFCVTIRTRPPRVPSSICSRCRVINFTSPMSTSHSFPGVAACLRLHPNYGHPEAEATLQRQRGLVLPNAAVLTDPFVNTWRLVFTYLHWERLSKLS